MDAQHQSAICIILFFSQLEGDKKKFGPCMRHLVESQTIDIYIQVMKHCLSTIIYSYDYGTDLKMLYPTSITQMEPVFE